MAATLAQIEEFLSHRGYSYRREEERGWLVVPFEGVAPDPLIVVVALEEGGRFLKVFAPLLFVYLEGPHKLALMETMLFSSWETKMLQWEYDPGDGEIRAMIEFPLEDALLTEAQFFRVFDGLIQLVILNYPRLKSASDTGQDPGPQDLEDSEDRLLRQFLDFLQLRQSQGKYH
jgi:hypothetical protein